MTNNPITVSNKLRKGGIGKNNLNVAYNAKHPNNDSIYHFWYFAITKSMAIETIKSKANKNLYQLFSVMLKDSFFGLPLIMGDVQEIFSYFVPPACGVNWVLNSIQAVGTELIFRQLKDG